MVGTFFLVVFDVVGVHLGVDHLARVNLKQQFLLLFLHPVDVFDLARLASLLFLAFNHLLAYLGLHVVPRQYDAIPIATVTLSTTVPSNLNNSI